MHSENNMEIVTCTRNSYFTRSFETIKVTMWVSKDFWFLSCLWHFQIFSELFFQFFRVIIARCWVQFGNFALLYFFCNFLISFHEPLNGSNNKIWRINEALTNNERKYHLITKSHCLLFFKSPWIVLAWEVS